MNFPSKGIRPVLAHGRPAGERRGPFEAQRARCPRASPPGRGVRRRAEQRPGSDLGDAAGAARGQSGGPRPRTPRPASRARPEDRGAEAARARPARRGSADPQPQPQPGAPSRSPEHPESQPGAPRVPARSTQSPGAAPAGRAPRGGKDGRAGKGPTRGGRRAAGAPRPGRQELTRRRRRPRTCTRQALPAAGSPQLRRSRNGAGGRRGWPGGPRGPAHRLDSHWPLPIRPHPPARLPLAAPDPAPPTAPAASRLLGRAAWDPCEDSLPPAVGGALAAFCRGLCVQSGGESET
ncbi:translation initiation factor IF-2-like [Rousettus aegyptiacus]|uniref:translation initiation factor IF-2-like n=1 Tax=Rousettus aegyptiacus TaxID=9407 RepID=UPI00168D223D|nr:translation initiation factor IF-2-like [Rousettus aegyptiacus]